jgi:RNA-binding protein
MPLTSKTRAELRAEAHHLSAAAHVGKDGLTPAALASLRDALRTRELIKVALVSREDASTKDVAAEMARKLNAEVVQVIGKTASIYRRNPALKRKEGAPPPWRR